VTPVGRGRIPFRGLRRGSVARARGLAGSPVLRRAPPFGGTLRARGRADVVRLVFRVRAGLAARSPPTSPRGAERGEPRPFRSMLALARPEDGFAPSTDIVRGPPRGEIPGRFRGVRLRRSPPRPSTRLGAVVLEVPTTGCAHMRKQVRATLLTLTPTLPSRPDPCGPALQPDFLSWGCPKIAPPSFRAGESVARDPRLRFPLRERTASPLRVPPAWFRTTSAVSPPRPYRFVSPCSRSWGSPRFPLVAKRGSSRRCSCPPEPSLRRQRRRPRAVAGTSPCGRVSVGPRHGCDHRWPSLHRAPCLLVLFLRAARRRLLVLPPDRGRPRAVPGAGASRPCSIVGSVAIAAVASHERPVLPWA
jgi:hypothetical protein